MNPSITSTAEQGISAGQKESCVKLITHATRKAAGVAIDELAANGVLNKSNISRVRARGDEVVAAVTALVKKKFDQLAENIVGCVRLISGGETLTLDQTDGTETLANATDLFTGRLDDFKNYGTDVPGKPTEKTEVTVHELIKDGDSRKIFGGLSGDLNVLKFEQSQIKQFVEKHRKWLRVDGATLFLFEVGGEYFVARVYSYAAGYLEARVNRFSRGVIWHAGRRHRVVVPQQAHPSALSS